MSATFAQLGVPHFICAALSRRGITEPFEIQAATIADGLAGRDVLGRAPTGSGKTIAFGVPLIATTERSEPRRPRALVLAPTRELAEQITSELRTFSGRLRVDPVYGGVGYGKQLNALRRGVDILVACPGRLEDLIARGDVDLGDVVDVVLDEADRMADMGFMPAVRRLLDQTSADRRTMLFSATLDGEVAKLTERYQRDPVRHEVGDETPDVTAATHRFFLAERMERNPVVADVVNAAWPSIVFTRTRHGADRLARQLGKLGFEAAPIHGGLSQNARQRALDNFAAGRVHALVATDVAARGIHVDGVASVVHYDPPEDHTAYIHRSGRTARAGAGGLVVSLVQPDQRTSYRRMQREVGVHEPIEPMSSEAIPDLVGDRLLAPPAADRAAAGERSKPAASKQPSRPGGGPSGTAKRKRKPHDRTPPATPTRGRDGREPATTGERTGADGRSREERGERGGSSKQQRRQSTARRSGPKRSKPRHQAKRGRGPAQRRSNDGATGRPNRKARRAHLQPGNR